MVEIHAAYDSSTHYKDGYTIDIQATQVVYNDIIIAFTAEQLSQNSINNAKAAIQSLEDSQTSRLLREAQLGVTQVRPGHANNGKTSNQILQEIEDLIQIERAKL